MARRFGLRFHMQGCLDSGSVFGLFGLSVRHDLETGDLDLLFRERLDVSGYDFICRGDSILGVFGPVGLSVWFDLETGDLDLLFRKWLDASG